MLQLKSLTAVLLCLALSACAPKLERPNISVVSVEMQGGNFMQQNFGVKLNVQNPNDRALPIKAVHAELSVGGEQIATAASDQPFVVPPFGESGFDLNVKANLALALLKLGLKMDQHLDSIDYEVKGGVSVDLPLVPEVPFHQSGSFSLKDLQ